MALRKTLQPTRITFGDDGKLGKKGVFSVAFNKFDIKVPKTSTDTALLASTNASTTGTQVTPIGIELDQPRSVRVIVNGTTANILAGNVVVSGLNFEGKPFTESFTVTAATNLGANGLKAFAVVTSISVPIQGSGVTYSLGLGDRFGFSSRNLSTTEVRLYKRVIASGAQSLVNPGFTAFSTTNVEDNVFTLDVTASGLSQYRVYAANRNWHLNPVNDQPVYGV